MAWLRKKNPAKGCDFSSTPGVCGNVESIRTLTSAYLDPVNVTIANGLKRQDPDLVEELVEVYQHRLLRYLVYLTGDVDLARDLFQETWLRVLERGKQYNGHARFDTWLFAIARNLMLDHLRRRGTRFMSLDGNPEDQPALDVPSGAPSPLQSFLSLENAEQVHQALQQLGPLYREVLVLRFQEELSLEEIAKVTGAPLSTIKSRLYRGMTALAAWLRPSQRPAQGMEAQP
jgi:RNA polymerase sigma-70 factor (ECF subfamily)